MGELGRVAALDGWRAIGVALVVVAHLAYLSSVGLKPEIAGHFLDAGLFGVSVFFLISGFVIARGLIREDATNGNISVAAFFTRRVMRIVPPLMLYVLTIILLSRIGLIPENATRIINGLTFTCNMPSHPCSGFHFGGHLWTLSVEEQFYVLMPLAFLALSRFRAAAFIAFALLLPFLTLTLFFLKWTSLALFAMPFQWIALGVAVAFLERPSFRAAAALPAWIFYALVVLLIGLIALPASAAATTLRQLLLAPITAIIVLMSCIPGRPLHRLLVSAPMQDVGRASYGIYLWQQLAVYKWPGAGVFEYAVLVIATVIGSMALYRWAERPLIGFGRTLTERFRRRTVSSVDLTF